MVGEIISTNNHNQKLEFFLEKSFGIHDLDNIYKFILDKDLIDLIGTMPDKIYEHFGTYDLSLRLEEKYRDENWLVVTFLTNHNPKFVLDKLEELEDYFTDSFEDKFLYNILFDVDFE